jgi:hypothetical protein
MPYPGKDGGLFLVLFRIILLPIDHVHNLR